MSVGKRLFQYALHFKGMIIGALCMLTIAVAAELAGPFLAKSLIDNHISGIESKWVETDEVKDSVPFNGKHYKRLEYINEGERVGKTVRILQVQRDFVFIDSDIEFDGDRLYNNGILTIKQGERTAQYNAIKLSTKEVFQFYRPEFPYMFYLLVAYLLLLIVASIFTYAERYLLQKSANRIIQKMRTDVFNHIQKLPIKFFDNLPAGKVVARITNDTEAIRDLYVTVLSTFFSSGIYITGIYVALFILNVKMALLCLLLLPALYAWMIIYRKFASEYNRVIRSKNSEINGKVNESIQGMSIIQAFNREKEIMEEFENLNYTHFKFQNKMLNLNALTSHNLVNVLRNIIFVAFIWYFGGISLDPNSMISIGILYAFIDYVNRLFQPVSGIVNQFAHLEQALVAGERVFKLLNEKGTDVSDAEIPRFKGNVKFENVSFGYKDDEWVLKNISFEAKQGETVAFVGHTGSGKSSIMNLLFRFYDPNQGRILIDGKDIKDIPHQALRRHMGIVLQDPFLFTGTIASNVSLENPNINKEDIKQALKAVGADSVLKHLPNGIDEPVIEKGSTLSAGQRQLISFARALAYNPAILILDEATSNIDTETESIIQQALDVLKKGRTTFVIAHRLSTIIHADQIIVLDQGEIVESGTHEQLIKKKGKYYQMYQLQQGKLSVEQAV